MTEAQSTECLEFVGEHVDDARERLVQGIEHVSLHPTDYQIWQVTNSTSLSMTIAVGKTQLNKSCNS